MNILLNKLLQHRFKTLVKRFTLKGVIGALADFVKYSPAASEYEKKFAEKVDEAYQTYLQDIYNGRREKP